MVNRRAGVLVAVLAIGISGCGSAPPSPTVSGSPAVSSPAAGSPVAVGTPAWREADLTQPSAVTDAPSLEPGYQCHPCHFVAENDLFGVGSTGDGFLAVGIEEPPAHAVAFSSTDGQHWLPVPDFGAPTGSAAVAVASNGGRTVVVGHDADGATAWTSNGGAWTQAATQHDLVVPYAAGAMTSVTAFGRGFVAGGYRDDPLHASSSAAAWRSDDGLTWHLDDPETFKGGRIWGVAAGADTVVAVGAAGDPNYGPAAAWRWTRAEGWQRARIEPGDGGVMRAVAPTPAGFVAVGINDHDDGARAWTSPDGLVWTAAPDQPAFHYFELAVRMQSVVAGPSGIVAAGWRSDAGKGSGVTWTSSDGVTWQGPTWEPSFSGAEISGLGIVAGTVVAVGRTGYPDWNTAAIWTAAP